METYKIAFFICCAVQALSAQRRCNDFYDTCTDLAERGECRKKEVKDMCPESCDKCPAGRGKSFVVKKSGDACANFYRPGGAINQNLLKRRGYVSTSETFAGKDQLSLGEVKNVTVHFMCSPKLEPVAQAQCKQHMCYHYKFRSFDGSCNNLQHPNWGVAFNQLGRWEPPQYDDGVKAPRGSQDPDMPSAREASRLLLRTGGRRQDKEFNALLMQWGQFLSHDLSKTTMLPNATCTTCRPQLLDGPCMTLPVDRDDPFRKRFTCEGKDCCIRTARSSPVCGTGTGRRNVQEQYNEHTAFIDAGMVYGNSLKDLQKLRDPVTGKMLHETFKRHATLPFDRSKCRSKNQCKMLFQAGDDRVNIFWGLIAMHTLFLREHNRLVDELGKINPDWDSERLFHEARKIVGAELQVITYNEYLPRILGSAYQKIVGIYKGYKPDVNPQVSNVFATSAFRFGHGQIPNDFEKMTMKGRNESWSKFGFDDAVFHPDTLLFDGVDPVVVGLCMTKSKKPDSVATLVTDKLFGNSDLAGLNIQRGREHGLPGYNTFRKHCGLRKAKTFNDFGDEISNKDIIKDLKKVYKDVDRVDMFVGQTLEDPVPGGVVGPTVACVLGRQFRDVRDGDRFWYQNEGVFTPQQERSLEKMTLARILCDNGDKIRSAPRDAFAFMDRDQFVECGGISSLDLKLWKD